MEQLIKLTPIGHGALYLRIPAAFRNANKLKRGDFVIVDFSQFKIVRAEEAEKLAEEAVVVTEEVSVTAAEEDSVVAAE
jgi:bifunctional DNA-binding transcriptional regulator/antitoxin component of YhaV-PrlF toxin-antitoxin module